MISAFVVLATLMTASHKSPRYLSMMIIFWILVTLVALYLVIRFSMAWIFPKDT